ncbi:MAG TPA: biopolymer transporter ExbD [bacterium]|nr:biopolymer transporter ExbD [bacterium]HPP87246.1 biopolymer transporter ExbD [bacterium]
MRFKYKSKFQKYSTTDIDIAPMVDVIFILLIFFMVTSTFVLQPGFKIELPEAKSTDNTAAEYTTIYINKNKDIFLNEQKVEIDELGFYIENSLPKIKDSTISINADASIDYGLVIKITDIAKLAGIKNIILTTSPLLEEKNK